MMYQVHWHGRISCLQGLGLTEAERDMIIRDISCGEISGVTQLGSLWDIQIEFDPKCSLSDLDKASRKLLAKSLLSGNKSGTITTSQKIGDDNSELHDSKDVIPDNSSVRAGAIPVRVWKDTFNNIMATLTSLCEEVKYAARAKQMIASIADNAKCSNITSLCVCLLTLEEIQELLELLSCSTVYPELDFFQLIVDKQEHIR